MSLENLVYNRSATSYQIGGVRVILGRLYILLCSDTGLHGACIPAFPSVYVNVLKTSPAVCAVEFVEYSHLPYVSMLRHKYIWT